MRGNIQLKIARKKTYFVLTSHSQFLHFYFYYYNLLSINSLYSRVKTRDRQAKVLSETIVQYGQQIESSEYCLQELTNQLKESRNLNEKLSVDRERNQLQVGRVFNEPKQDIFFKLLYFFTDLVIYLICYELSLH